VKSEAPEDMEKTFCIIRNPLDRLYHMWDCPNLRRTQWRTDYPTFEAFIDYCCTAEERFLDVHAMPQSWFLQPIMPKKIINFHYNHGELREIGITLNAHCDFSLPGRPFYTDEMLEQMRPRYGEDFKLWARVQSGVQAVL
jgi:hypothetical protein